MVAVDQVLVTLKPKLGEGCEDLGMRFGLHSGPVTGGILRGEKARFQIFGDTVNTTSRIETLGRKGKIHISEETAELIKAEGKEEWLTPREDKVKAKGKGMLQTFWLSPSVSSERLSHHGSARNYNASFGHLSVSGSGSDSNDTDSFASDEDVIESNANEKIYQLIDTSVDVLERLLKKVMAKRGACSCSCRLQS